MAQGLPTPSLNYIKMMWIKFWECDNCCTKSISTLPFSHLDEDNWLTFNEIYKKPTSDNVNILSAEKILILQHSVIPFKI